MRKNILSAFMLSMFSVTVSADTYILDTPKAKQPESSESSWKVNSGIIAVPKSVGGSIGTPRAQTSQVAQRIETSDPYGSYDDDSGILPAPSRQPALNNNDSYGAQPEDLENVELYTGTDNNSLGSNISAAGVPIPETNLSTAQRKEKRIKNRSRRDVLNLDLKDDSIPRNAINHTKGVPSCSEFQYNEGLLKSNLSRLLAGCGYTIGQWNFGNDEYDHDFPVKKAYSLKANNLVEFLQQAKKTYLVDFHVHELDKTVDFGPSRGERLEDLELKYR